MIRLQKKESVMKEYLEIGQFVNTHGVKGDLKLEVWADSPQSLTGLKKIYRETKDGYREYEISRVSVFKEFLLCHIAGIDDIDDALPFKGKTMLARREDIPLPEGGHFIADLIGLDVYDYDSGIRYGRVTDMYNRGASDIYVINTGKDEVMVPAVGEFVREIHIEDGDGKKAGIYLRPIKGMFDEAEEIRPDTENDDDF